jgi:hypothetical protein
MPEDDPELSLDEEVELGDNILGNMTSKPRGYNMPSP